MSLQKLLGIELPVIQAPMAVVQAGALAMRSPSGRPRVVAVRDVEYLRRWQLTRENQGLILRAFNVNFFCHTPSAPSAQRAAAWRAALALIIRSSASTWPRCRRARARAFQADYADVLAQFKPAVVIFTSACRRRNCSPACARGVRR